MDIRYIKIVQQSCIFKLAFTYMIHSPGLNPNSDPDLKLNHNQTINASLAEYPKKYSGTSWKKLQK